MESSSDKHAVAARVRAIIATVADVPIEVVPAAGSFLEPLGLDSMMVVAIAVEIQDSFDIELPRTKHEMLALGSVAGMARFIATALEGTGDGRI